MPIRGVLFDVDDTLFDYSSSEAAGLLAHLRQDGSLDRFADPAAAVALWREITELEYTRFVVGELSFPEQQRARARTFLSRLRGVAPTAVTDPDALAWFTGFAAHRRAAWSAFPDAEPVLRQLAPGYRLGIVSNAAVPQQQRKLAAVGLLDYFGDRVVCSEEHGAPKPEPSIFLAGCAVLGLAPDEVAYVGDKYAVDAVGAHDAGLRSCWLDRANTHSHTEIRDGIHVIATLEHLPPLLTG
ncbi:HAD family hydrolase [Nocardia sp. NPDC051833]|uniref:HAD family hydrolase n=1 Tax=Nocardia sp. NPDC051833 TaxID=3155674 RepID=UPI003445E982